MIQRLFFSKKVCIVFIVVSLVLMVSGCGSGKEVVSSWSGSGIKIDGNSQDWQGSLQSFPDEKYSAGFKNDNKYLYLCFVTSDRDKILKIMRSGLNVAFESPNDAAKDYTIRFPLINPGALKETIGAFGADALQKEGVGFLFQELLDKQMQFNLVQKDFLNTISFKNKEDIEVKMGTTNELLVYEIKVPLAMTKSAFPIGALPGEKINIKVETDPSKVAFREGANADQSAPGAQRSGRGGRGGAPGGASTGDTGGGGANVTEKFSVGFAVQLAKENR